MKIFLSKNSRSFINIKILKPGYENMITQNENGALDIIKKGTQNFIDQIPGK